MIKYSLIPMSGNNSTVCYNGVPVYYKKCMCKSGYTGKKCESGT